MADLRISAHKSWLGIILFVTMMRLLANSQATDFLAEVDVYTGLTPRTQFWFQAKQTNEDGTPTQVELGPSVNFFVKPMVELRRATTYDLDETKKRLLVLSVGYRYLPSPNAPTQNRILLMLTPNIPFKGGVLVSDRNRLEVNFSEGNAFWRYRNKVTLQRTIAILSFAKL
jgi:hypothetical protein